MSSDPIERTKIFISYSHKDKRYLDELCHHLEYFQREKLLSVWNDEQIVPGARWFEEINRALAATRVAVLLVSADFFASEFINTYELPPLLSGARNEKVTILPVIISACSYDDTQLKYLQSINDPNKPLNLLSRGKRELVWVKTVKRLMDIMIPSE